MSAPSIAFKWAIFTAGMVAFLQMYSVQAVLPDLMAHFKASVAQVASLVGMTVLGVALISPVIGMLSDRFGRRGIIIMSASLLGVITMALGFLPLQLLGAGRFLQGLLIAGVSVVSIAYASEEYPKSIKNIMPYYVSGTVMGGFLGRFILGHITHGFGIDIGFLVLGAFTLLGAIFLHYGLPISRFFVAQSSHRALAMLMIHAKNNQIIIAMIVGAAVLFCLVAVFSFINLHLARAPYFFSASTLANLFSLYLIGMLITPLSGKLSARFGNKITLMSALALSGIGALLLFFKPFWLLLMGLIVVSSGVFIAQSTIISHVNQTAKRGRSAASGLYYLGYYLGGALGAWVGARAYDVGGFFAVIACVLVVLALATALATNLKT